jgi:nitroreductase
VSISAERELTRDAIETVVGLACRAPSLHNSQPWRWVAVGHELRLYHDGSRLLASTDTYGRQMIISCGAALHHLQVALAASGWQFFVDRCPNSAEPHHLATVWVSGAAVPTDHDLDLGAAIGRRHSDRMALAAPTSPDLEQDACAAVSRYEVTVRSIAESDHVVLADLSARAAATRRYDQRYQDELRWWSGHSPMPDGVPLEVLLSTAEHGGVPVGRKFPTREQEIPHPDVVRDRATVLVMSTTRDSQPSWLRCGEALSALLLTYTAAGMATCPLTHLTELPQCRSGIASMPGQTGLPQVLVRVGLATGPRPAGTNRRAVADVLTFE